METGTVDGQENPYSNILSAKFYEVQKHLTITRTSTTRRSSWSAASSGTS
jgi:TRAP-type C4-dicarboxylate transport system substrate-binding protein